MSSDKTAVVVVDDQRLDWALFDTSKESAFLLETGSCDRLSESDASESDALFTVQSNAVRGEDAVAVLPTGSVLLRTMEFPASDDEEIRQMVSLQVDKISPFPADDSIVSYEVLDSGESISRVLIGVAQLAHIEEKMQAVFSSGVKPAFADVAALCALQSVSADRPEMSEGLLLVVFELQGSLDVIILDNGTPLYVRHLDPEKFLTGPEDDSFLAGEIVSTLVSLELEQGVGHVDKCFIFSDARRAASVSSEIEEICGCSVVSEEFPENALYQGAVARATASGTVFNLLPQSWIDREKALQMKKKALRMLSIGFVAWIFLVTFVFAASFLQERSVESLKVEFKALKKQGDEVRNTQKRVRLVRSYMDREDSALACLREVTILMPDQSMALDAFSYFKDSRVRISGTASSAGTIYDFKKRLDGSKMFAGTKLDGPTRTKTGQERFDIELYFEGGEVK